MSFAIWLWCLFKGAYSFWLCKGVCSLYFMFSKLVLHWFLQGNLFPLTRYVCLLVLLASSLFCKLVLRFLIYTILTFDQKKRKSSQSAVHDWFLFRSFCYSFWLVFGWLCCWLDAGGSRLSPCIAPLLVVGALGMAHAIWIFCSSALLLRALYWAAWCVSALGAFCSSFLG